MATGNLTSGDSCRAQRVNGPGRGPGSFTEANGSPFDLGHATWHVAVADVNRDGKATWLPRRATACGSCSATGAAASNRPRVTVRHGQRHVATRLGDVNGDGKPDVATSNLETNNVTVLLAQ